MSRRLEITVPNVWAPPVRDILQKEDKCNFNTKSGKPNMVVEVCGIENTIFFVTIPGPAVGPTLEILRKNGIGTNVGRVILSTLDFMKPDLAKPLTADDVTVANMAAAGKKPPPLKGLQHFMKARKTTEEMYNEISNNAQMTINTWMNLIGASVMAAGGLITGALVFIVAAMLVSPIMGPILGMTMGYRVADFQLFRTGFYNEIKMAITTYLVGCFFGVVLGDVGDTYKWPNSAMMPEGQGFNLVISIIVSAAAGMVLGVSLTAAGGNALVGTAISAGLLPPLVNAGMLMSYSFVYATKEQSWQFYEMGIYAILFYFSHVITIITVANLVFWLKAVDPRFKEGEDASFDDCPTLMEHKRRLEEEGKEFTEKEKAEFFIQNIKDNLGKDVKNLPNYIKGNVEGFANIISGGMIGGNRRRDNSQHSQGSALEETVNPMQSGKSRRIGNDRFNAVDQYDEEEYGGHHDGDIEMHHTASRQTPATLPAPLSPAVAPLPASTNQSFSSSAASSRPLAPPPAPAISPDRLMTKKLTPRDEVVEFYRKYNPEKLSSVDGILSKYQGKEGELLTKLHKQYNVPM